MQPVPSLTRFILVGAIGFCFVSLCVFATVAFAEGWMYDRLSVIGAYLAWTILFILLGGSVLKSLVVRKEHKNRFYFIFAFAFLAYAAGWMAAYFVLKGSVGEWVGSFAGSVLMAIVLSVGFGVTRSTLMCSAILFIANSLGYFLGSEINNRIGGREGMLLWGTIYGLFLGAGLGLFLYLAQTRFLTSQKNEV